MSESKYMPESTSSASWDEDFCPDKRVSLYPETDTKTKFESDDSLNVASKPNVSLSVLDVAAYILEKMGNMSTMKLQKLVYYCQAWSLVWDEKPLFSEPIEAWANGPVVRKLFDHHRGQYQVSRIVTGNPRLLKPEQTETVDTVLDFYGSKTAQELIDRSHAEPPWQRARQGLDPFERGRRPIRLEAIHEYFSTLAAR